MSFSSVRDQANRGGRTKDDADFRFSDDMRTSSLPPESDGRRPGSTSNSTSATLSPRSREYLRLRVNARERQRMHDMNLALDALRRAMPYAQGPAVKKLSKMNTLLLARNYILLLTRTLDELRRLLVATSGGEAAGLTSRRHAHPDVDALRSFVVRDLNAEHQRYAEELIRREQQQQQQVMMMQEGGAVTTWNYQQASHNSVTSSSSPDTPPRKKRRGTASPARAPLLPAENNIDDIRPPTSTTRDVTAMTSSSSSGHHVVESPPAAVMGHVLATQFACPCPHCRDSKPTYIVPLDFASAAAQLQHRSTAQI